MNKYLNFEISNVQIVENSAQSKFAILQVDVCRSGNNTHRLPITKEAIQDSAVSVKGVPILTKVRYDGKDFMGHEIDEIAVGYFSENEPQLVEGDDGELYIRTTAKIWKAYFDNVVEILKNKEGKTDVSMEMQVLKGKEATPFEDGLIELFCIIGVTLLGVNPSIKGAKATVLSFSELKRIGDEEDTVVGRLQQFANSRKNMAQSYSVNETTLKDTAWGDVDKTELRNKVMEAMNRDMLVHKVYALVEDGWQDAPSEHLKYPLMELVGDTFYYNRYALASALAYAKQENEGSVVSKVESLYKKFNLDDKEDSDMAEKKFTDLSFEEIDASVMKFGELNGRKIYDEVIKKIKEKLGDHMFVRGIYDNKIVVEDYDKKELVDIPAKIKVGKDDEAMSIEIDYDKMKKSTVQHDFADDGDDHDDDAKEIEKTKKDSVPNDDDDEGSDEDAEEFCKEFAAELSKVVKMGLDAQAYAGAMLQMLRAETIDEIRAAKMLGDDEEMNIIMDTICDMACERFELREYKCAKEKEECSQQIARALAEVKGDISDEDFAEFQKKADECQFADQASELITTIKAFAYEKSKGKKVKFSQEDGIIRMSLPIEKDTKPTGDVFDRIMNK